MKKLSLALSTTALMTCALGTVEARTGASMSDLQAIQLSHQQLQARAAQYGIQSARAELSPRAVFRDALQSTHVRLDQTYRGLPVFGQQLVTHFDANGRLYYVSGSFKPVSGVNVRPSVSSIEALKLAQADFGQPTSVDPTVQLVVLAYEVDSPVLAYQIELKDIESDFPAAWMYFIDAHTGRIVLDWDNLHTTETTGVGRTQYSGNVEMAVDLDDAGNYMLVSETRGGMSTTNLQNGTGGNGTVYSNTTGEFGDNTGADQATAGADAHFGAQMTWDYYESRYGRQGIRDDGQGNLSRTHYSTSYVNAFWDDSCFCMTYGDGDNYTSGPLTTLDVAGHEMTHGLTSVTAGLIYAYQSGGLNESMSDIFGTAVEFHAADQGVATTGEYWIGEDCWTPSTPNDALRYMDDPRKDGLSIDNAKRYRRFMDVHYTSGVSNNVFFLASEGGTNRTSGNSVVGIGRSKVEAIFFRALTTYMTPTTDWAAARQYTVQAAQELYGQYEADGIAAAWSACGVR